MCGGGHTCHGTPGRVKGQGPLGTYMMGVGSLLSCGFWGLDVGRQAWWQTLSPPLPSHLPMAVFYQSSRSINNVHGSLHSRLTNRSILAFLPLSPCRHCGFRQSTQEMPAHCTPPIQASLSCAWWPGPSVSGAGLVLAAQLTRALDAGAGLGLKVAEAQLFTPTQRV